MHVSFRSCHSHPHGLAAQIATCQLFNGCRRLQKSGFWALRGQNGAEWGTENANLQPIRNQKRGQAARLQFSTGTGVKGPPLPLPPQRAYIRLTQHEPKTKLSQETSEVNGNQSVSKGRNGIGGEDQERRSCSGLLAAAVDSFYTQAPKSYFCFLFDGLPGKKYTAEL